MEILLHSFILVICIAAIAKGADILVDSSSRIARSIGVSELTIGLTVVALGTSAPEFGVTIYSAMQGIGNISVGNVVGSNIFNLGFILGGTALIRNLPVTDKKLQSDNYILLFVALLLSIFLWNLTFAHWQGAILFILLFVYLIYLYFDRKQNNEKTVDDKLSWYDIPLLILGLALIMTSSHFMVSSAVVIAEKIGVSEWVIGTTIIAAGTSVPEFATSVVAALRGKMGISIGNLIGSTIFNICGVLGLAGLISNLTIDSSARIDLITMLIIVILAIIFIRSGWKITRREGTILVSVSLIHWLYNFFLH